MPSQTAKSVSSKTAAPKVKADSSPISVRAPEPKMNVASQPNALLGRSLAPATAEMRRAMIAEAAYYIAEQRAFVSGRDVEDWLLAEKQIDAMLAA